MTEQSPSTAPSALHVLTESAAALSRGPNLEASLRQVLEAVVAAGSVESAAVLVQDPDLADSEVAAAVGVQGASRDEIVELAGGAAALAAATSLKAARFDAPRKDAGGSSRFVTLLPLVIAQEGVDRQVGMLVAARNDPSVDAEGRAMLTAAADVVAAIIERVQLRSLADERADWYERVASSDALTGLASRYVLERVLAHEVTRAGRSGSEVSVAIFDVDGFRAANDSAGREVGDVILREVASAIAATVRMVDTVARLGGDEFVVVAPGSAGLIVARRVMATVGSVPPIADNAISVSAGVARFPLHGATVDELLGAAGTALELAKASGPGGLVEAEATPA